MVILINDAGSLSFVNFRFVVAERLGPGTLQPPRPCLFAALVDGIRHGICIGLVPSTACCSSSQNFPSAQKHENVVDAFIAQQLAAGFMTGPLYPADCSGVTTSNLAVVPKKTLGKWRVIVNLSRPQNASVNDFIRRNSPTWPTRPWRTQPS